MSCSFLGLHTLFAKVRIF